MVIPKPSPPRFAALVKSLLHGAQKRADVSVIYESARAAARIAICWIHR
jgi:hypothetical protein